MIIYAQLKFQAIKHNTSIKVRYWYSKHQVMVESLIHKGKLKRERALEDMIKKNTTQ